MNHGASVSGDMERAKLANEQAIARANYGQHPLQNLTRHNQANGQLGQWTMIDGSQDFLASLTPKSAQTPKNVHIKPYGNSGEFVSVRCCQECGARGDILAISFQGPCPKCGSTKIKEEIGRYVGKVWQLRGEEITPVAPVPANSVPSVVFDGTQDYLAGASQTPLPATVRASEGKPIADLPSCLRAFHEATDRLESVHHRMRLVYARGNLVRRSLRTTGY